MLALGLDDGSIDVFERSQGGRVRAQRSAMHRGAVRALAFGDDDELYSLGSDDVFGRWRVGRPVFRSPLNSLPTSDDRCYPRLRDPRLVAVEALMPLANTPKLAIWLFDLAGGSTRSVPLPRSPHGCSSIDVVQEHEMVVRLSSGYDPIYVVRKDRIESFDNPLHAPSGLATVLDQALVSRNGTMLLATSNRSAIVLIDLDSGTLRGVLEPRSVLNPRGDVTGLALSDERRTLLTAGSSGVISWSLDPTFWVETALRIANRGLPDPSERLAPAR